MKILVLNCGSSSVKYQLFELDPVSKVVLASGIVEEVGLGNPTLTHRRPGQSKVELTNLEVHNHTDAIQLVLDTLVAPQHGVLDSVQEVEAVGHRVVHGGERFASSVRIDSDVMQGFPPAWRDWVERATQAAPSRRFASLAEAIEASHPLPLRAPAGQRKTDAAAGADDPLITQVVTSSTGQWTQMPTDWFSRIQK